MEVIHKESLEKMLKIMKTFPRVKKTTKYLTYFIISVINIFIL